MNSPLIPIVYLVYREVLSSVLSSQVLTPLEEHRGFGPVLLGLLTPVGQLVRSQYRPALQQIADRCRQSGIVVGWLPSPPTRLPWLWSDAFVLRQWISKRFQRDQPFIVRCRSAVMTGIALDALRDYPAARVVYDCRGAEVTETIQLLGAADQSEAAWSPAIRQAVEQATQRERRAVRDASGVTCVSQAMVDMLRANHPDQPVGKFHVIPCCPDVAAFRRVAHQRDVVRQELGFSDKFVVTYLGSLAWYQLPEASLRLFRLIQAIRPHAHFFAITTQPDTMRQLATQAGISSEDMTIRSVPARDVPRLLVASDLGLMLRDDSETNRVASPVKLGEYLAAGVPVVITPRLGDYSATVKKHGLGVEVDLTQDETPLTARLRDALLRTGVDASVVRSRCFHYAETELSWSGVLPRLADWYRELLDSPPPALSRSRLSTHAGLP